MDNLVIDHTGLFYANVRYCLTFMHLACVILTVKTCFLGSCWSAGILKVLHFHLILLRACSLQWRLAQYDLLKLNAHALSSFYERQH
jgi:hypothetical protein